MIITKGASDPDNFKAPVFYYRSARDGLRDFLMSQQSGSGNTVLLPAFVGWSPREGSGVFDPVAGLGLEHEFYALNRDLTVDVDDLRRRITNPDLRAVVLIQYFGRTDPSSHIIRRLADQYDVPLVEDLAHGFFSSTFGRKAGSFGHVRLYSLHKLLPIPDGAMACYESHNLVKDQTSTFRDLASVMFTFDWRQIAFARRANYEHLAALLLGLQQRNAIEFVWPSLGQDDVPQSLPVYVLRNDRDTIYELMNKAGFGVVSLYHTLIPQIVEDYRVSHWAARHILNLPVHQDIAAGSYASLVAELERCVESRG